MKLYGGIDLHSNNCVFSLCNADGQVVARRKLPNEIDVMLSYLVSEKKIRSGTFKNQ